MCTKNYRVYRWEKLKPKVQIENQRKPISVTFMSLDPFSHTPITMAHNNRYHTNYNNDTYS